MIASPVLYAKGYSKTDGETPIYFWGLGSYKYEIESRPLYKNVFITKSDVFEASYEDAREKFEAMIEPDTEVLMYQTWRASRMGFRILLMYDLLNIARWPDALSFIKLDVVHW